MKQVFNFISNAVKNILTEFTNVHVSYHDAVEVITNGDITDFYKNEMIAELESDMGSEYYKSVINIAKSNMTDFSKLIAIRKLK